MVKFFATVWNSNRSRNVTMIQYLSGRPTALNPQKLSYLVIQADVYLKV